MTGILYVANALKRVRNTSVLSQNSSEPGSAARGVAAAESHANVVRLSTARPTASGLMSITGPTSYPPPPGSRGSVGAVTVNCAKSDSGVARFWVTMKLPKIRRK